MPNSMIDARLSLESAKLNFQLAQFHYSSGIGLDINTQKPKLQLRRKIERKDLDGQISEMFYVTLGTESDVDSDMAIAFGIPMKLPWKLKLQYWKLNAETFR